MKSLEELLREAREAAYAGVHMPATPAAPAAPTSTIATRMRASLRAAQTARKLAPAPAPGPTVPQAPAPAPQAYWPSAQDLLPELEPRTGLVEPPGPVGPTVLDRLLAETRRITQEPTEAEKAVMLAQSYRTTPPLAKAPAAPVELTDDQKKVQLAAGGRYTPGVPIEEQKALKPMGPVASEFAKELVAPYSVPVESTTAPKTTGQKVAGAAAAMAGRALNPVWRTLASIPGIKLAVRMGAQAVAGQAQKALSGEKVTPKQAALDIGVSTAFGLASDYLAPVVQKSLANTLVKHFPETLPKGIEKAIPYIAPVALGVTVGAARGTASQVARAIQGEPINIGQAIKEIGAEAAIMGVVNGVMAGVGLAPKGRGADFYKTAREIIAKGGTGQWTMLDGAPSFAFQYDPKTASVRYVFGAFVGKDGKPQIMYNFAKFAEMYEGGGTPSALVGVNVPSVGQVTGGAIVPNTQIAVQGAPVQPPQAPAAPQAAPALAPGQTSTAIAPVSGAAAPESMTVGQQYVLPPELGSLRIALLDPKTVGVDPDRFQFKATGKEGVTSLLKGVTKWKPALAGRVLVWEDKDGKPWVVNGHHRLELAKRTNTPAIEAQVIREVDGVTESKARMRGALSNMGEGRGDATDVARFLRESKMGPEDLKNEGISLREKTVAQGVALAGLSDQLWRSVLDGDLKTDLAIVIGRDLPGDVANQQAVVELLARMEKQGRHLSDTILAGVIAQVKSGETTVTTQATLFGEDTIVSSNAVEKAEILEYVLKQLRAQKTLFNKVSKTAFSQLLEKAGNVLATDKNLEELTAADMGLELVQRLAYTKGSAISQLLNQRAGEMVTSQNRDQLKRQAFDEILALVKEGKALEESIGVGAPGGEPGGIAPVQAGSSLFGAGGAAPTGPGGYQEEVPQIPPNAPGEGRAPAEPPTAEVTPPQGQGGLLSPEPQAAPAGQPQTFSGWHTPVTAGLSDLALAGSAGLPAGYYVALDKPFESDTHDAANAAKVRIQVKNVLDPDGLLNPANKEAHQLVFRQMGAAMVEWAGQHLPKPHDTMENLRNYLQGQREAMTDYLKSKGFDAYIRGIDGDPKNRELIVFQDQEPAVAPPAGQGGLMAAPEDEFTEEAPSDLLDEFSEEMPPDLVAVEETPAPAPVGTTAAKPDGTIQGFAAAEPVKAPIITLNTDPEKKWYRIGGADEFSEFTFDPHPITAYPNPQMTGGRGTGFATGQYAFGEAVDSLHQDDKGSVRIPVSAPSNPLMIGKGLPPDRKGSGEEYAFRRVRDFQEAAISMMRFAAGAKKGYGSDTKQETAGKLAGALQIGSERLLPLMESAIADWSKYNQVHPMNILLSRLGYNGVEFVDGCKWAANSGDYGNVRFPPITYDGELVGMEWVGKGKGTMGEGRKMRSVGAEQAKGGGTIRGFAAAEPAGTATAVQSKAGWYPLYVTAEGKNLYGKTPLPTKDEAVAKAEALKATMEKPKEGVANVPTAAGGPAQVPGGAAPAGGGPVQRREPAPGSTAPAGGPGQVPATQAAKPTAAAAKAPAAGKQEVVNARPDIKPPDISMQARARFDMVPEIHASLMPHQVEGTLYSLQALDEKGCFACVDGPGAGKTRVGLAVGYMAAKDGKSVLVLTERDSVVQGAWLSEAAQMGITQRIEEWPAGGEPVPGLIQIATYSKMRTIIKKRLPLEGWDLVVLDECHNLKRTEQSQQAAAGEALINGAKQVLFMSATPFDRIHEYWYMGRRLGTFSNTLTFERWLDDLGIAVIEKKLRVTRTNKITGEEEQFKIRKKVYQRKVPIEVYAANLRKMGDDLTRDGLMIKREVSMDGLDVFVRTVPLPEEALQELDDIAGHYNTLYRGSSKGSALTVIMQRRFLEKYKIDSAVQLAKEELAQGRQVGIFVEYKNESDVTEKMKIGGEVVDVRTVAHAESVIRDLRQKLSEFVPLEQIAELHGGLPGERPPDTEAERLAFQAGDKKVAIATISAAGTGISLHDDTGKAPRTQIVVTLPWSGVKQLQVALRMHRLTSASRSKLIYLMADHEMDEHLAEILAGKMQVLGATVQGDLQKLDLKRGELMAELDEATVRGGDDELEEGELMDNDRIDQEVRETQLYETQSEDGKQRIDVAGPAANGSVWMAKLTGVDPRYGFEREFQRAQRADPRHAYFEVEPGAIYEINDVSGRRILQASGDGWTEISGPAAREMLDKRSTAPEGKPKVRGFIAQPGPRLTQLGKGGKAKRGTKPPPSQASIIKLINDDLTPVFMKHLTLRTKAEYHADSQIIRLKEVKLKHALHELGHHLDDQFPPLADLIDRNLASAQHYAVTATRADADRGQIPVDPAKRRNEIAAELFVGLMLEPDVVTAVDPAFNQFDLALEAAGLQEEIGKVRAQVKEYMGMDLLDRMKAQIVWTSDKPDKLRWTDLTDAVFDQFDGLRRAEEAAVARSAGQVNPSEDAYLLAQLASPRAAATADHWLTVGQADKLGKPTGGKSLQAILSPIKGADETETWVAYATAKVARQRMKRFKQQMPESADFYDSMIQTYETPERLKVLEESTEWAMNYWKFLQTISEAWSEKVIANAEKDHTFYLPLHRAMDERVTRGGPGTKTFASIPNPIKKSHGSTRPFMNPIANLVQNAYLLANFAMRNEVGASFLDLLEKYPGTGPAGGSIPHPVTRQPFKLEQMRPYIEDIVILAGGDPKKIPDDIYDEIASIIVPIRELAIESENIISVWKKGKPTYMQLPKDVFRAFRAMGAKQLSGWMKILGYPARLVHATAIANPAFALMRNPVMDTATAFTKSVQGQKPVIDWIRGLVSVIKKDPTVDIMKYMGGTFMKPGGWDRVEYEKNFLPKVLDFQRQQRARGRLRLNPLALFQAMEKVAETLELPSRVREMQLTLAHPRWNDPYDNLLEAVYNGLEVTMNWRKAGYAVKEAAAAIPFFSTKFVIAKKTFDAWAGRPSAPSQPSRPGAWKGMFVKSLLMFTLPTLALFAINRKNKDYEELPDWRKTGFWNIPVGVRGGRTIFLPLPRVSWEGLLFGGMVENVLVNLYTEDSVSVDTFLQQVAQDALPSFLPTFFQYMLLAANVDPFTKRPIVPEREQDLPVEQQVAPWTTAVARILGSKLGISPRKIDAAIKTYGSGFGALTAELLNVFFDGLAKSGRLPQAHPANWVGMRGFLVDPYQSSDSVNELYDLLAKSRKAMARAAQGYDLSAAETELAGMSLVLEEGAETLSACRSTERDIRSMTGISKSELAKAVDLLRAIEIDIARVFLGKSPLAVPDVDK